VDSAVIVLLGRASKRAEEQVARHLAEGVRVEPAEGGPNPGGGDVNTQARQGFQSIG
jgi:hypothetical protein